ncbi:MAG: nitroreductase [Alphaproteobacteria bacterium]
MEVSQAIRSRRAVRDFTNAPVSVATLRQVIAAASWAPSAMNGQPWHFTVVTDAALLDRISDEAKAWALSNTPQLRQSDHFRDLLSDPAFHLLYNAPALIVISAPAEGPWAVEDCAVAAQNLMLAAVELGLGTCWIGFAQGWLASEDGRRLLNLPDKRVIAPITIGYPRAPAPVVARKAVMLSWIGERPAASEPPAQTAH